jgi:WD40 repeat protein
MKVTAPLRHRDWVLAVAYGPHGTTVLTGSWDRTARLWNAESGQAVGEPLEHEDPVGAVAVSGDGQLLVTGSRDGAA